ncbi:transposase [Hymenobacter sp. NBH84]|nr:transposase [Hymenobacter sp. NBH84]
MTISLKKAKFTEVQIVFALRQADTGVAVAEVCRKMGINRATYYNWKPLPAWRLSWMIRPRPSSFRASIRCAARWPA